VGGWWFYCNRRGFGAAVMMMWLQVDSSGKQW